MPLPTYNQHNLHTDASRSSDNGTNIGCRIDVYAEDYPWIIWVINSIKLFTWQFVITFSLF